MTIDVKLTEEEIFDLCQILKTRLEHDQELIPLYQKLANISRPSGDYRDWSNYYSDLDIPKDWVCMSYHNDSLPSFSTEEDNYKAYHVWINSHNDEIRETNNMDIFGQKYYPRFQVVLCYGYDGGDAFITDDFEEVLKYIKNNPKDKKLIELTKQYI